LNVLFIVGVVLIKIGL